MRGRTFVIREIVLHRAYGQLLLEAVDFVEKEDDGCLDEPARVADGIEECQCLLHAIHRLVLEEQLVVFRYGDEEEDRRDIFEAVDPLFPLGTLTADIKHAIGQVTDNERRLSDARGLDAGAEDVLVVGHVVGLCDTVYRVEVATNTVSSVSRARMNVGVVD